ncbi:unnamed protein product [Anisakis simplex]|uniref:HMG box domain-containing protein n=1 Tax=Anisakis simplex TaxID=6269 RepID=A0A0M3J3Y4_ANISI|nr:unnamed protein product [Anisakis simplex]
MLIIIITKIPNSNPEFIHLYLPIANNTDSFIDSHIHAPVSAYALFFRDTQAAIKGRTPNATFGEVSKIVASMWDALDAKREYLKRLAAYRASQISQVRS